MGTRSFLSLISVYLHKSIALPDHYFPLIFDRAVTRNLCVSVGDHPVAGSGCPCQVMLGCDLLEGDSKVLKQGARLPCSSSVSGSHLGYLSSGQHTG